MFPLAEPMRGEEGGVCWEELDSMLEREVEEGGEIESCPLIIIIVYCESDSRDEEAESIGLGREDE
jgi:hypothetical protein